MATTIVNPPSNNAGNNGMGFLIGIIVLILFLSLFFVYLLPLIRDSLNGKNVFQFMVPSSINVNVKQSK